jgi:hypothetical protein
MAYTRILSVVTPASDTLLVSLDTTKDELNILDTSIDTRITRWITEESAELVAAIGRPLRAEAVIETLRANSYRIDAPGEHFYPSYGNFDRGTRVNGLSLRRYPIQSVTSIVEDGTALDPAADYEIDAEFGIVYRLTAGVRIAWYGQTEVITYTGGYPSVAAVPSDIAKAVLTMVKHRRAGQTRDPMLRQVSIPGVIDQQFITPNGKDSGLPQEVCAVIDKYRDVHI